MIRVLHYGMSPNLGGIETYLLNLTRTLDRAEVHSDFLYSDGGRVPHFAPELQPLGFRFFGVTPRRANFVRNRHDLADLFRREQFDILHFHTNTVSYIEPIRAALLRGVRVLVHSHNAGASRSRATQALHRWHRRTLPWERIHRVAVSREAGRWMFGGGRPFEVINNGIETKAFAFRAEARTAIRASLGIEPGALLVGQVGAFLPAKNHAFTLTVFAEVARRRPNALLLLVGAGPEEEKVRERVDALRLRERVLFLGRRSDVPELLSALDTLVLPSLHEGFPLVALEAQASGLPCLLSDTITPEVAVSPLCHRLPLLDSPSAWAELLLATPVGDRSTGTDVVEASDYSIEATTAAVADLYLRISAR